MRGDWIGIIPAAGLGTRLKPFRYPKELLPVVYQPRGDGRGLQPRAVGELALEAMVEAGIDRCLVVIAPWKLEIATYLGNGAALGMDLAYIHQEEAKGLPAALDLAYRWTFGCHVAFAMPDTIVRPAGCLAQLRLLHLRAGADLTLAVFPTREAARLGPVVLDGDRVAAVYDKCPDPPANNTWGMAIWGPAFSELLHAHLASAPEGAEPVLGDYFELAVRGGLNVRARFFPDASFTDIGTPEGIMRCVGPRGGAPMLLR